MRHEERAGIRTLQGTGSRSRHFPGRRAAAAARTGAALRATSPTSAAGSDRVAEVTSTPWAGMTTAASSGTVGSIHKLGAALQGRELVYGYPEELASQIADRMALSGAGRVPILDRASGRLVGIVGRKDLFRSRARRLREESRRTAYFRRPPPAGA